MSDIIVRPPTIREIYERIMEKINKITEREVANTKQGVALHMRPEHPDRHMLETLEEIFRPVEESSSITPAEFFTALFNKKNHEEKQRKPGETNKGTN